MATRVRQMVVNWRWLGLLGLLMMSTQSLAAVDVDSCVREMERVMHPEVDCEITFQLDELPSIRQVIQYALADMPCVLPLRFRKAEIYNDWITEGQLRLPRLPVQCRMIHEDGSEQKLTSFVQPACQKSGSSWSCQLNMSGTEGIGFLGSVLEIYLNAEPLVKRHMRETMEALE